MMLVNVLNLKYSKYRGFRDLKSNRWGDEPKCIFSNAWMPDDGYFFEGLCILICDNMHVSINCSHPIFHSYQLRVTCWQTHTWRDSSTDLLGGIINMTNKWHSLDKPLPKAQDRCTQPWWHKNPNQEDESYGSYETETWPNPNISK